MSGAAVLQPQVHLPQEKEATTAVQRVPCKIAVRYWAHPIAQPASSAFPVYAGPMYELCSALRVPPLYHQCSPCVIQQSELECCHYPMHSSVQVG
jgi:hypothetical protein